MTLKEQLMQDLKESMKAKDSIKKSVVTLIKAAIKQVEVDSRIELKDEDILEIISKQLKQRREALAEFEKSDREDLISQTKKEIEILLSYLPKQLSAEELEALVKEAIQAVSAESKKDMGKVMGYVMPKVKGKADGKQINAIASKLLK